MRDEAEFLYRYIEMPRREIGLFDEREYFLGETALLAGTACRQLSRRDEAIIWFDRAEAGFRHTINSAADLSRLGYQRLAERLEERQFDVVLEMLPALLESFRALEMHDEALKGRFLEGLALMESDELTAAVRVFDEIVIEAEKLGNSRLLGTAFANLTHIYGMMGNAEAAVAASANARSRCCGVSTTASLWPRRSGVSPRSCARPARSPHRSRPIARRRRSSSAIGMRADVAALNLVIADLLLETGRERDAQREIASALPVISELKMAPEGMAALQLLRESARRQEINRQALRDLHGYFEELHS